MRQIVDDFIRAAHSVLKGFFKALAVLRIHKAIGVVGVHRGDIERKRLRICIGLQVVFGKFKDYRIFYAPHTFEVSLE